MAIAWGNQRSFVIFLKKKKKRENKGISLLKKGKKVHERKGAFGNQVLIFLGGGRNPLHKRVIV